MKTFPLAPQINIPALGLGTWQMKGDECQRAVEEAIAIGYRHIDTAQSYENHEAVGAAIKQGGLPRNELFITSKIKRGFFRAADVPRVCAEALQELGLDYLDLYLIHWPDRSISFAETLSAMQKLQAKGLIRTIGVSNFTINHLKDALATGVPFVVNQVEFHPSLNQKELKNFCDEHHILLTAYSPLGRGAELELPVIKELAQKYQRSPAQVILNWIIAKGIAAIPKAGSHAHLEDNFKTLEWELAPEDIARIDAIDAHHRVVNPEWSDFDY